jgi:hypothetical protein
MTGRRINPICLTLHQQHVRKRYLMGISRKIESQFDNTHGQEKTVSFSNGVAGYRGLIYTVDFPLP